MSLFNRNLRLQRGRPQVTHHFGTGVHHHRICLPLRTYAQHPRTMLGGQARNCRAILASAGMPSLWSLAFHQASTSRSMFVSAGRARYFSRSSCCTTAAAAAAAATVGVGASGMAKKDFEAPILAAAVAEVVVTGAASAAGSAAVLFAYIPNKNSHTT